MQPGINIEDVKKYNASLREYKERASKLTAEIEFNQQELNRQCAELSTELGIQVTPENVRQILEDRVNKINNTMSIGNDILNRIKAEENSLNTATQAVVNQPQVQASIPTASMPVAPTPLPVQAPVEPVTFAPPVQTAQPGVNFNEISGDLPPIFAQGSISI